MGTKRAFVLMPFRRPYNRHYSSIFEPALQDAGFTVSRADDLCTPRPIVQDIQESILKADLLLCEMSGRNPNVFYELGMAHAIGRPVVLVSQNKGDIPFDVRHIRVILYDQRTAGWANRLRNDVTAAARACWAAGQTWPPPLIPQPPKSGALGIREILVRRGDASHITAFLTSGIDQNYPAKRVRMLGQSLAWLKGAGDHLMGQLLAKGCRFQFLLLDPSSRMMRMRTEQENPDLRNECLGFIRWVTRSFLQWDAQIEIRLYDLTPTMGITIIDDHRLFASPYAMTQRTHVMPSLILAGGDLFQTFVREFERLWKMGYRYVTGSRTRRCSGRGKPRR